MDTRQSFHLQCTSIEPRSPTRPYCSLDFLYCVADNTFPVIPSAVERGVVKRASHFDQRSKRHGSLAEVYNWSMRPVLDSSKHRSKLGRDFSARVPFVDTAVSHLVFFHPHVGNGSRENPHVGKGSRENGNQAFERLYNESIQRLTRRVDNAAPESFAELRQSMHSYVPEDRPPTVGRGLWRQRAASLPGLESRPRTPRRSSPAPLPRVASMGAQTRARAATPRAKVWR